MTTRWRFLILLAGLGFPLIPPSAQAQRDAWPELPVLHNGRVMPVDTYARTLLLSFSGRSTFDRQPAASWLARTLFTPAQARTDAGRARRRALS